MKYVRVRDLKCQIGSQYPRPTLLCLECGGEYSADAGDYFMARPDTVMRCCERPMALVTRSTVYRAVRS